LRAWAVRPFVNLSLPKNTTDMSLAVDAMELACMTPRPKLVVIGSGDLDFVPLVVRLRERGIKVVCVTERSKMAQDAAPAYDQVIYVGGNQLDRPVVIVTNKSETTSVRAAAKKVAVKAPATATPSPKPAAAKETPVKKIPAKKSTVAGSEAVTVTGILTALPNLKAGEWQPLGDVAKVLHDKKFFKKVPLHFELKPAGKPNQVRFISP
jgi:hypothetical protein